LPSVSPCLSLVRSRPLFAGNLQSTALPALSEPIPPSITRSGDCEEQAARSYSEVVPKSIRVALVNDYMIVLEGLRALLKFSEPEIHVVEMDVRKKPRRGVDVSLLDTYGGLGSLSERVRALGADPSNGAIVVFSFSDRPDAVRSALRAGAVGFISKAVQRQQIIDGIKAAASGERVVLTQRSQHNQIDEALRWPGREIGLTERESEILSLLSTGMTNRELGSKLYVSENTIKTQLRSLYSKLGVRSRAQAAALAEKELLGDHGRQAKLVD
jgi:NarL family two-component system response regulator LiaR